jgi:predicted metallo-beta-lactamase superfamily hydrolase
MDEKKSSTIEITCPCCDATLIVDPALGAVLDHKVPAKPHMAVQLKDAVKQVKEEASRRDEKYQKIAEAEKNKSKVLEAKFQELFKKAKEEPITKPLKDIDLD